MQILEKAQTLLERTKKPSEICRIYLQRIDHIYFKFDPRVIQQRHVSTYENFDELLKESQVLISYESFNAR